MDLIVTVIPAADDGCAWYRMTMPGQALKAQGADVEVWRQWDSPDPIPRPSHVYVIQRPVREAVLDDIDRMHEAGAAVVVDLDDDFANMSRQHTMHGFARKGQEDHSVAVLQEACRRADILTVTTSALAGRYGDGNARIIPNYISAANLDIPSPAHARPWVGWTGTVSTHPRDLPQTAGGVGRAVRETGSEFVVVGNRMERELIAKQLELSSIHHLGWRRSLDKYMRTMAQFDVAIVPLEKSRFNDAKSDLKGKEAASVGVPFIATPTVPYRDLHALGIGQLAYSPQDWYVKTKKLLTNPEYRAELGNSNRERSRSLTVEANCGRWMDAWAEAFVRFHSRSLSPA